MCDILTIIGVTIGILLGAVGVFLIVSGIYDLWKGDNNEKD